MELWLKFPARGHRRLLYRAVLIGDFHLVDRLDNPGVAGVAYPDDPDAVFRVPHGAIGQTSNEILIILPHK